MTKDVKSAITDILKENDDRVMMYLQGITNVMTNHFKCKAGGTQHIGDDSVTMFFTMPNDMRKYVGTQADFTLDLTFNRKDFVITLYPDFENEDNKRTLGPYTQPIKDMHNVLSQLVETFFQIIKNNSSSAMRRSMN